MNPFNRWLTWLRSRPLGARALGVVDRGAFALPAALTALALLTIALRVIDHVQIGGLVKRYQAALGSPATPTPPPPGGAPAPGDPKQKAELEERTRQINQRNLFSNPPPTPPLTGTFGDEAFFGGQGFKAGQSFMNVKVVKINGDSIEAEVDGKATKLYVFGPGGGAAPGGGGGPMMMPPMMGMPGMPPMMGMPGGPGLRRGGMRRAMPGVPVPAPAPAPGPGVSMPMQPSPSPAPSTQP